jgi:hypothetical protein
VTRNERVEFVRRQIAQFEALQRKDCSFTEWIMLKLSCSRLQAERLIAAAQQTPTPSS